ncbi:hypothetical protein [Metarhizobium album]|uniref:hypothetical protein n=1 Tax=Metarhizobium album TaxID=2182425 RepID=UPI00140324C9|nr:hypothetical protein [Rhizobium album]
MNTIVALSPKSEERQNGEHDNDGSDKPNDLIHGYLLRIHPAKAAGFMLPARLP